MEIGIFSRTFCGSMEEAFLAVRNCGLARTHLNLLTCGMETMPSAVDENAVSEIARTARETGVLLDGLSGTFNMIAPDLREREEGISRFKVLCEIASLLGIPMISLCTGSRNPESKWKWDDRNLLPDAWDDLLSTTEGILADADSLGIILGVETEASNIINTPERARLYLDRFRSPNLKIIMDAANLFETGDSPGMRQTIEDAFALLGGDIVQAHAKDLKAGPGLAFAAAGKGIIDFPHYIKQLNKHGFRGTIMLHGLEAEEALGSAAFLRDVIAGE